MGAFAVVLFAVLWMGTIVGVNLRISSRRAAALMSVQGVAQIAGLTELRARSSERVLCSWRGHTVTWRIRGWRADGPERLVVEIAAVPPTRMAIHRRRRFDHGFRLLGPSPVRTAFDAEHAVRGDDIQLAERLLGDERIAEAMRTTIQEHRDELELTRNCVRVTRVTYSTSRDQAARAAWQLAAAVVEQLDLTAAGSR